MIYITGDVHRKFDRLKDFPFQKDDILIILGDAGINYTLDMRDVILKYQLNNLGLKFFLVRGNHEERPENIETYEEKTMFGGKVLIEPLFPNLIFAKDGEIYNIDGNKVLVLGGAYSVDMPMRVKYHYAWFKDEQLSKEEMDEIYDKVKGQDFDIILSHTTPYKYEPREVFSEFIDDSTVDKSMEHFLDKIEEDVTYTKWYCGHYHTDKVKNKIRFMFNDIEEFSKELNKEKTMRK